MALWQTLLWDYFSKSVPRVLRRQRGSLTSVCDGLDRFKCFVHPSYSDYSLSSSWQKKCEYYTVHRTTMVYLYIVYVTTSCWHFIISSLLYSTSFALSFCFPFFLPLSLTHTLAQTHTSSILSPVRRVPLCAAGLSGLMCLMKTPLIIPPLLSLRPIPLPPIMLMPRDWPGARVSWTLEHKAGD